jgi:hypothetical protein
VPVTLEAGTLHHALARMQEWDRDAAMEAEGALGWLGWDAEGPLQLRRYDLQLYLWYQLPTKYLAPLERHRATAAALGRLLELTPAAAYAQLCTAPETLRLLEQWDARPAGARREVQRLLAASGIEPSDTAKLAWGSVMGPVEAQARDDVSYELELALEAGTLVPRTPGFARRQADLIASVLVEPEGSGSRLDAVHLERLQRWRDDHRSPAREAIVARVADMLTGPPQPVDAAEIAAALGPARWLLGRAVEGIALTQTGALNRALVREAVERWPEWWRSDVWGPPNREDDVVSLRRLHDLLRALRLLRRTGRRIVTTARARTLLIQPASLLDVCATALLSGETFDAAVGELAAALLLAGDPIDYEILQQVIHPVIVELGWRSGATTPSIHAVGAAIGHLLAGLESLDLVAGSRASGLELKPIGQLALHIGLRARALGPAMQI